MHTAVTRQQMHTAITRPADNHADNHESGAVLVAVKLHPR